jgi:D-serine deaminase-like pyridoxal phosphate-dependent protein
MKINQLDTPCLIIDKAAFDENRRTLQTLMQHTNMQLRPHYKSHRCPAIARLQIQDGAKGMTCAKLGEAEDLAAAGIQDILIANQIVQPEKLPRLAELAGKCRLTVCVDCAENVLALEKALAETGHTLYCLVEYDIGMKRCGVDYEMIVGEGMFHCYPVFPVCREAKEGWDMMVRKMKEWQGE